MIDTIHIIDILNGLKNWVIKWSGHSEKGTFTTEVAGKHEIIFRLIENYPQNMKVLKLFSYIKHQGKWQNVIR